MTEMHLRVAQILITSNTLVFRKASGFCIRLKGIISDKDSRGVGRSVFAFVCQAKLLICGWISIPRTREKQGAETSRQPREMFISWQSRTKVFFNHRRNTGLFTRWWLPQEVPLRAEKWKTSAAVEGQEERDGGWSGWYYGAEVRKTQCVFGINETAQKDGGGNRRQYGVELWSSALCRAYPITAPLPWVKMPWFSTLHPSLTLASPQPTATQGHNWLVGREDISSRQLTCVPLWLFPWRDWQERHQWSENKLWIRETELNISKISRRNIISEGSGQTSKLPLKTTETRNWFDAALPPSFTVVHRTWHDDSNTFSQLSRSFEIVAWVSELTV